MANTGWKKRCQEVRYLFAYNFTKCHMKADPNCHEVRLVGKNVLRNSKSVRWYDFKGRSKRVGSQSHSIPCFAPKRWGNLPLSTIPPTAQWGAVDAEIKIPSGENTVLKHSASKAWSRSVYSHTFYAYCQGFLPCLFLPFWSIRLHFFQNLSRFLLCWLWPAHGSCIGPQNEISHPAGCRFPCWLPAEYK